MKTTIAMAVCAALILCGTAGAATEPDPETVFRAPPQSARTGVWWHWMGCNVSRDGIVKDLDWFREMGVGAATIFSIADSCIPWSFPIANSPSAGLVAYTPEWWRLVRFACEEAEKRGIEIGVHNCPGYTSTGGPWIPSRLAMRELVFNVTNAVEQLKAEDHSIFFAVKPGTSERVKLPVPSRHTDVQEIGVVNGIRIAHVPLGSHVQPAQWEATGLECDKMNPEAVAFHLDHVLGDIKRHLGEQVGRGLRFILLDSYEAGTPTWTPKMREEFTARRGYDPLRFLPILGGFTNGYGKAEIDTFKRDFSRTRQDLYRDVLFKTMREKCNAAGLEFACEPYWGPFDTRECAAYVDRLMTEFWFNPRLRYPWPPKPIGWETWKRADGARHNVIEAEAFTASPRRCRWNETPALLKGAGDQQFMRGINRFVLHSAAHQPWDGRALPGAVMGRWGTHFGRTQTWAKSGKGWFDYLNRCQALLQWGHPAGRGIDGSGIAPKGSAVSSLCREAADGRRLVFVANHENHALTFVAGTQRNQNLPEWFNPVTGRISVLSRDGRGRVPLYLAPHESGFLVLRRPVGAAAPSADAVRRQKAPGPALLTLAAPWRVTFPPQGTNAAFTAVFKDLKDWTESGDVRVKYFSGTAVYRATFDAAGATGARILSLGQCNDQIARVTLNGRDLGTAWCAPWEVEIPDTVLKAEGNELTVEFTNVWANRLIGDEQEPPDCEFAPGDANGQPLARFPDWFVNGTPRPSQGRVCFTLWNFFTKNDKPVPSGLIGPVTLR